MNVLPTLDQVIALVREETGTRRDIQANTRIEHDLGVTGDDGDFLFKAAEQRFGFAFSSMSQAEFREAFGLEANELLFAPECSDVMGFLRPPHTVTDLSIAQFHKGICRALEYHQRISESTTHTSR